MGGGHSCDDGRGRRFTNTAVPRFNGTGRWQQHILIVQAIVRSNGWSLMTAALQLFAHLDGEALHVALLMPVKQRERWQDLVDGLSEYYNSPGRLAVVRRRFESASRRSGMEPATFATELGILAMRGFADMGERARDLMIRNKFIAAQQSCELRHYLDGAAADASITIWMGTNKKPCINANLYEYYSLVGYVIYLTGIKRFPHIPYTSGQSDTLGTKHRQDKGRHGNILSKYLSITVNKLSNGCNCYSYSPVNGYLSLILSLESQI